MNVSSKDLIYAVAKASDNFTENYRAKLNEHEYKLSPDLYNTLYDLGAEFKHAFDDIIHQLEENQKE